MIEYRIQFNNLSNKKSPANLMLARLFKPLWANLNSFGTNFAKCDNRSSIINQAVPVNPGGIEPPTF